ncbi:MAG: FG-GAP-like repeat-containing protein [Draconibacterium sp.]|nr:FG-GAP-like repeat-containing protein [Draconibacterium sp.]
MVGSSTGFCQDFDITLNTAESGTKIHQARNSITFGPNYSYTPSGGTMTAEIVNPVVTGDISYNSTIVDPETRSLNTSYMVGATKGSFNVTGIGGANYSIPIDLPPGVAGLSPGLSLSYNSHAGQGIAGYGWNINGLSAITRSGKNYYNDGATSGVDLTISNDKFLLDGQRLVGTSGSYGGNNSEYRTEIDAFTKVICLTDGTATPKRFLVKTKSGLELQYGYEGDSDQTIDGLTEEISWYIDKVTDVYGNTMEFEYIKDKGYNYIGEITYGPNTITFFYKQRADTKTSFLLGEPLEQRLILDKIEIEYNSTVVKKYELKYNYSSSNYNRHSILNEIIEYGVGTSRYNSTAFKYQGTESASYGYPSFNYNSYLSSNYVLYSGDFNGDGRDDVYAIKKSNMKDWKLYLATEYGTFSFSASGSYAYTIDNVIVSDINADGKEDLILVDFSITQVAYLWSISSGTSFGPAYLASLEYTDMRPFYDEHDFSADFDGDGVNDCLVKRRYNGTSNWDIYSMGHNGTLDSSLTRKYYGTLTTWGDKNYVADFNGDGKTDIWILDSNGLKIYTVNGNSLTQLYSSTWPTKDHYLQLGDFNGDGKTDMFVYGYSTYDWSQWQTRISNGTGFEANYFAAKKSNLKDDKIYIADFNSDGQTDILALSKNSNNNPRQYYFIANLNGDGFSSQYKERSYLNKNYDFTMGNFDGNAKTDVLITSATNGYRMSKTSGTTNLLCNRIADGLNNKTYITYRRLTDQYSNYEKGTANDNFPIFTYEGPLMVVSESHLNSEQLTQGNYYIH